jgi:cell division septation protein DedD
MADQNVREIQLGGKQLVFLFMASVVLAVAIFLLGISVGRGVGAPEAETTAAPSEPTPTPPAAMPPRTETTPEDNKYHRDLTGQTETKPQPPPDDPPKPSGTESTSVAVTPPATPATKPAPQSTTAPPPTVAATSPPSAAAKPTAAPARGTPPASGWYVQVAAFKSRENADRQVSQLKAKGYAALVQADPGSLFRVRIGPFQERTEANSTAERLKREENIGATVGR